MDWFVDSRRDDAIATLRAEIDAFLLRHAVDPGAVTDAQMVVAELLSNAARHAAGPTWVAVQWTGRQPVITVNDLGPGFVFDPQLPADPEAESGRGLFIASHLADQLSAAARAAGGTRVSATLPVSRRETATFDPPRRSQNPLPNLDEATPGVGFGKESFLRALVVQLAQTLEATHGPAAAEAAVAQVGADVGGQMEDEYRAAAKIVGRMTPQQIAECYVRLKHAIDGQFFIIEATPERIVLGNTRCPFGDVVRQAPQLCRMTSSVFGGIAARNSDREASVVLEERIAVGDPGCRVVVFLDRSPDDPNVAHRYRTPEVTPLER
ncbi:MAG TPA: methanogen output domain 1-containing protein [Acidimicrobiales bacterium]|nr:methanogen output domain 1-containing protein [Acidimicrobiales bacterium]